MVIAKSLPEGFKQTEVGVIPKDWCVKSFKEICWINQGLQISISKRLKLPTENSKKYLTIQYLSDGKEVEFINDYTNSVICCENDVLMTRTGNTGIVITNVEGVFHNNFFKINYNEQFVIKDYLVFYLTQKNIQKLILSKAGTSTIPDLNHDDFYSLPFVAPHTKEEQIAIATALTNTDKLITQLEHLIVKKRNIKQGAMQELLKPKEGWVLTKLGDVAHIRRGASPRPINDSKWFSEKGRGWIRISDVTCSNVYLNSTTQYLSEEGVSKSVPVNKGDLIMSICATIGIPIIINIEACIHDGFVVFRNYENFLNTYFLYFFLQAKTETLIEKGQPGTQKNLNTTIVGNIEIGFPDLKEQQRIGKILTDMDTEITALEQKLNKYKMVKQGMMQQLLTGQIRLL